MNCDELFKDLASGASGIDVSAIFRDALKNADGLDRDGVEDLYLKKLGERLGAGIESVGHELLDGAIEAMRPVGVIMSRGGSSRSYWTTPLDAHEFSRKPDFGPIDFAALEKLILETARGQRRDHIESGDVRIEAAPMELSGIPKSRFWPRIRKAFAVSALATTLLLGCLDARADTGLQDVFNTVSVQAVLKEADQLKVDLIRQSLDDGVFERARSWKKLSGILGKSPKLEQIRAVNAFWNALPYKSDIKNWNSRDKWAAPSDFMRKGGDCEDYAIAKYASLRKLGFGADEMRIIVGVDTKTGEAHAMLAVQHGEKSYILDNRTKAIRTSDQMRGKFMVAASINENMIWKHMQARQLAQNDISPAAKKSVKGAGTKRKPASRM